MAKVQQDVEPRGGEDGVQKRVQAVDCQRSEGNDEGGSDLVLPKREATLGADPGAQFRRRNRLTVNLTDAEIRHLAAIGRRFHMKPAQLVVALVAYSKEENPLQLEAVRLWGHLDVVVKTLDQISQDSIVALHSRSSPELQRSRIEHLRRAAELSKEALQRHRRWLMMDARK